MTVGFIGGGDVPLIHKFEEGFVQGVKSVDPTIEVLIAYAGSFTDPAKGKELAISQYNSGADIIYQAAGPTGTGIIEAAQQMDRFVIGVDADQNPMAPDHVITSMLKKVDIAVFETIKSVVDGNFEGGQRVFGVENDGIGLAPFHSLDPIVPQAVKDRVAEATAQLKSGEIQIELSPAAGG
jgi:basic membrane protein A and related proteins